MACPKITFADAEALGDTGPHVVHEHVGGAHELVEQRRALGLFDVDRHAPFAPVEPREDARHAVVHRSERTHEVTRARSLDLDDIRALFREDHRREGACRGHCAVDDAHTVQRAVW